MPEEITEVGDQIWNHISVTGLSRNEVEYLDENNKITEITVSKRHKTTVCIFLATEGDEVAFISYGEPIEDDIDWEEILAEVEEVHENMTRWAEKRKRKAKEELK